MYEHGFMLKTDADFHNAILFGLIVSITQEGEHVGSGRIISQSDHVIKTIDASYFKSACKFIVCLSVKNKKSHI